MSRDEIEMDYESVILRSHQRVEAVIEALMSSWPADALADVVHMFEHNELGEAISLACAHARTHGYGPVRDEMLALAEEFGEAV